MGYPNPVKFHVDYNEGAEFDFGGVGTNNTTRISATPGKDLKIARIALRVTEEFDTATTNAKIQFGTAADADKFGEVEIPDGLEVGMKWLTLDDGDVDIKSAGLKEGDRQVILSEDAEDVVVTLVCGTGNNLAGKAKVTVYCESY